MTNPVPAAGLLVGSDLFFASKITGTAAALGGRIEVAASMEQARAKLAEQPYRCVLIDLGLPGLELSGLLAAASGEPRPVVVAFGPHVQTQSLQAARDAGCDAVLPRSRLSADLPALLRQWLGGESPTT